jgi:hypothetical protein
MEVGEVQGEAVREKKCVVSFFPHPFLHRRVHLLAEKRGEKVDGGDEKHVPRPQILRDSQG